MNTAIRQGVEFTELSIESIDVYNRYLSIARSEISNSCFASRWAWNPCFFYHYAILSDCLCMISTIENINQTHLVMPFGEINIDKLEYLLDIFNDHFSKIGKPLTVMYVEEKHLDIFSGLKNWDITCKPETDFSDYVYSLTDLSQLKGHKYSSPRNHINRFLREHGDYVYQPMTKDDVDDCLCLAAKWCDFKGIDQTDIKDSDFIPLERTLNNYNRLSLMGGTLKNSEGVRAFIIGSKGINTITVHFQKASKCLPDLYAVIQYEFCKSITDDSVLFINREDDMGIANIRAAKTAYHPIRRIPKYTMTLRKIGGHVYV